MAARALHTVSRVAVERAKARMPGFTPDTVEVVELARGRPYVVVRTAPAGLVVLDERGRLVRGRVRLAGVARHLDLVRRVNATLEEASLERRREHVEHSILLLARQRRVFPRTRVGHAIGVVLERLETLRGHLEVIREELERQRAQPPTERTLRRTIGLLNAAAGADREVVRAVRKLAFEAAGVAGSAAPAPGTALRRWAAARLASSDLPYFHAELHESEGLRFVELFVASARA